MNELNHNIYLNRVKQESEMMLTPEESGKFKQNLLTMRRDNNIMRGKLEA